MGKILNEELSMMKYLFGYQRGKVISEQKTIPNNNISKIQQALKNANYGEYLGTSGPNKDGVDGVYGKNTKEAIMKYQSDNGIKPTGFVGSITSKKLGVEPMTSTKKPQSPDLSNIKMKPSLDYSGGNGAKPFDPSKLKFDPKKPTDKTDQTKTNKTTNCVGLDKEMCSKISVSSQVKVGSGGESQCARYVTKCLSQYDKDFYTGNAWQAAGFLKGKGGKEKYNMFKSDMNWSPIFSEIKSKKITKSDCSSFVDSSSSDWKSILPGNKGSEIQNIATKNIPGSSSVNISILKPGDVVGLWHKDTTNKGRAFCERLVNDLKLDDNGKFKELPFTYNTHVGFVTAIKNGVPIIAHNVHGTYYTVPATKLMSKNDSDMITWVISDPDVEKAVSGQ